MNLQITNEEWSEKGVTISLKGEFDVYTAAEVRQKILDIVDSGRCFIAANLEEVNYLDSTGLGVLIGALRRAREHEGDMAIVCAHPRLLKIFEITGLARIFRIFADETSAVEALTAHHRIASEEKA